MTKQRPHQRTDYVCFSTITTRWNDNDPYAHVNNVVYYEWFDTAINEYLIKQGVLDVAAGEVVGLVVKTGCSYFAPVSFPDVVHAGIRVARLGNSSVGYQVGIFRNDDEEAAAQGEFVHVYVNRKSRKPVPLPTPLREALTPLQIGN